VTTPPGAGTSLPRLLLARGAQVELPGAERASPLWGRRRTATRGAKLLLAEGADPLRSARDGASARTLAERGGFPRIAKMLEDAERDPAAARGHGSRASAPRHGRPRAATTPPWWRIEGSADVNARDDDGRTALIPPRRRVAEQRAALLDGGADPSCATMRARRRCARRWPRATSRSSTCSPRAAPT
jgi:hypothetical protein